MSYTKSTTRISKTGGPLGNLQDYHAQYPALLPKYFFEMVRQWDEQFPESIETIFPEAQAPAWAFQWNVFINPREMAPFVEPNSNTPMVTADAKYETFVCKQMKEGFYVNSFDLHHGLPGLVSQRTKQVMDAILLRIRYSLVLAASGVTWNGQNNARMSYATILSWARANSTPLGDLLTMMTRVYQMAGAPPSRLWLDWTQNLALHNHPAILNQLQYVDKNLLTNGMVTMIKTLAIGVVKGYYKEAADESQMVGAPGRGDQREDITPTSKHWLMEDYTLLTLPEIGYNMRALGEYDGTRQWFDEDKDQVKYKVVRSFTPVVTDYAKVGRLDITTNPNLVDLYTTQGTTY